MNKEAALPKSLEAFFKDNEDRAKIVFTSVERKAAITAANTGKQVIEGRPPLSTVRSLRGKELLIITDEEEMRGTDFRCEKGIDLFIDETLKHERSFIQALGRVGRYTESCGRFYRPGLTLFRKVDHFAKQEEQQLACLEGNSQQEPTLEVEHKMQSKQATEPKQ